MVASRENPILSEKERNALEKAINTRLQRLELILNHNAGEEDDNTSPLQDEDARLDELSQIPVDETLITVARQEKNQLLNNLEWLRTDGAGLCRECGEKIPIQRLLSVPTTRYCIRCARTEHP